MTEQEYLASEDPAAMLEFLTGEGVKRVPPQHTRDGRLVSGRQLRFFASAVWRGHPAILRKYGAEDLPAICERIADGEASEQEVSLARERMGVDVDGGGLPYHRYVRQAAGHLARVLLGGHQRAPEERRQSHLLRDIVGNPWRPVELPLNVKCPGCDGKGGWPSTAGKHGGPGGQTVTACRRCDGEGRLCPWLTLTVVSLAHAAYDHRDPTTGHMDPVRLAVLADALTDAGCDAYGPVVWHLRGRDDLGWHVLNHPHVRGCHVIDRLLGKE